MNSATLLIVIADVLLSVALGVVGVRLVCGARRLGNLGTHAQMRQLAGWSDEMADDGRGGVP